LIQKPDKILIIQTAFLGDVVLATALIEKLAAYYPESTIDFLVRKGSESLLNNNPHLNEILVFDKSSKYKNLTKLIRIVRSKQYDLVLNVQRFLTTSLLTAFSAAKKKAGFSKSPLSFTFTKRVTHDIESGIHEISRNQKLIEDITDSEAAKPRVYPSKSDYKVVQRFKVEPYITISPASVWYTKQFPLEKWLEFLGELPEVNVFILGSKSDRKLAETIVDQSGYKKIASLAGQLSLLQSAALMDGAVMNFSNDSAPMHLASAVNAPVAAIFCSTVPDFGFGPLSDESHIIQVKEDLKCRPCGLHGKTSCPQKHFKCAKEIKPSQLRNLVTSANS
jgi:heptosyltransferase-2